MQVRYRAAPHPEQGYFAMGYLVGEDRMVKLRCFVKVLQQLDEKATQGP